MFLQLQKTQFDWQFYTEPNNLSSLAMNEERSYWPRGKVLGGSSSINFMVYMRGNRRDYDTWERMGNTGWDWDTVLDYFKKSEDNTDKKYVDDIKYHATGGLLKVGSFGAIEMTNDIFKEGFKELGYKEIAVANGNEFLGFFDAQGTVYQGERFETAKGFLSTAKERKNLHIIKNAHVTEITFDTNGSVNGVEFLLGKDNLKVVAKNEVVLSAGTIGSPQLLMLSGIGPEAELKRHNILVRKNLPVGLNLQDHILIPFGMAFDNSTATVFTPKDIADQMYEYTVHRKGYYFGISGAELVLFLSTIDDPKYPNIQIHSLALEKQNPGLGVLLGLFNLKAEVIESFTKINNESKVTIWCVILLNPKSRGRIQLASQSPFDKPKIHNNYLFKKEDVDVLVNGIKRLNQLSKTEAFAKHEGQVIRANLPACDKFEYQSDLYWECYVRHMTATTYHPVGTCKMGSITEPATVVDPELKVKGVDGLRVVDASIMPKIVSGNTNAPSIMIGEMAADMIKTDWL